MILLRALNDFDILGDPLKNGSASKTLIYGLTKNYYSDIKLDKLIKPEKEEYMKKYIETHKHKLYKMYSRKQIPITNTLNNYIKYRNVNDFYKIIYYLSSLPTHIGSGNKTFTDWLGTTDNFDKVWRYYESQKEHKIAVLNIPNNGIRGEETLVVNVSTEEAIKNLNILSNKIKKKDFDSFMNFINYSDLSDSVTFDYFMTEMFKPTNEKFMGFDFARGSQEFSVYNYIDPKYIISIMDQLLVDYLRMDRLETNFLSYPIDIQQKEEERLKQVILNNIRNEHNFYMEHVFRELYIKNKNINHITSSEQEKETIINTRNNILNKSLSLKSPFIKN